MANFPQSMEYPAEFLRGWPVDGGQELDYPIANAHLAMTGGVYTDPLAAGDLVQTVVEGGVVKVEKVDGTVAGFAAGAGIVVRGNGDDKSCAASGKALVLWGNYIVRTQKVDAGVITAGAGSSVIANASAVFGLAAADTDVRLGTVIEAQAAVGSNPAYAVIVVR